MIQLEAFESVRGRGGWRRGEGGGRKEASAEARALPPADARPSEDGLMCDGMACQHCICSICRSAGLLWQPAHPRSLFFLPSPPLPPPELRTNRLFIWGQNCQLRLSGGLAPFSPQPDGFRGWAGPKCPHAAALLTCRGSHPGKHRNLRPVLCRWRLTASRVTARRLSIRAVLSTPSAEVSEQTPSPGPQMAPRRHSAHLEARPAMGAPPPAEIFVFCVCERLFVAGMALGPHGSSPPSFLCRCNVQDYIWHKGARCEAVVTEFQVMCLAVGASALVLLLLFMIVVCFAKKLHMLKTENKKLRKRR